VTKSAKKLDTEVA